MERLPKIMNDVDFPLKWETGTSTKHIQHVLSIVKLVCMLVFSKLWPLYALCKEKLDRKKRGWGDSVLCLGLSSKKSFKDQSTSLLYLKPKFNILTSYFYFVTYQSLLRRQQKLIRKTIDQYFVFESRNLCFWKKICKAILKGSIVGISACNISLYWPVSKLHMSKCCSVTTATTIEYRVCWKRALCNNKIGLVLSPRTWGGANRLKLHFEYCMVPLIDACFNSILEDVPRSTPERSKAFDSVIAINIWKYGKDMFGLVWQGIYWLEWKDLLF